MLDATTVMKFYRENGKRGKDKYIAKINAYDGNPAQEAIAKEATLLQRFNDAVQSGKWRRALSRVDPAEWKRRATTKGADNFANSFQYDSPQMRAFLEYWLPKMAELKRTIRSMPNATKDERRARRDKANDLAEQYAKMRTAGVGA